MRQRDRQNVTLRSAVERERDERERERLSLSWTGREMSRARKRKSGTNGGWERGGEWRKEGTGESRRVGGVGGEMM